MNIAVFASGKGSNFSAILKSIKTRKLRINLSLLVCDNPSAPVLKKAKLAKVNSLLVRREDFASLKDFENKIIEHLNREKIDLIVLAGFMRILSKEFVRKYKNRIINIHPSLLPSFKGTQGIKDAFDYGVKVTGITVHFVDEKVDHGPIIMQMPVQIDKTDSLEKLEKKIHKTEHLIYPEAIRALVSGKLKMRGRKVIGPT